MSGKSFPALLSLAFLLLLASCAVEPGPLYGTWADNLGDTLSFFDDNTFNAKIINSDGSSFDNYSGNYSLLLNALTLDCAEPEMRTVTEWDIRGNILYMEWVTPDRVTRPLKLYKVSN